MRPHYREAAVLAPLIETDQGLALLVIKRAPHPKDPHSGQLAFPGGRIESSDKDPIDAALRETEEEIGVQRQHIEVIQTLPSIVTGTGYKITPIMGHMQWPIDMTLQTSEVHSTLVFPIDWLNDPTNIASTKTTQWGELIWHHPFKGEVLWGATARMCQQVIEVLKTQGRVESD